MSELVLLAQERIESGVRAYAAVEIFKADPQNLAAREAFARDGRDLGYGLLLKSMVGDLRLATARQKQQAAWDTVPNVPLMF